MNLGWHGNSDDYKERNPQNTPAEKLHHYNYLGYISDKREEYISKAIADEESVVEIKSKDMKLIVKIELVIDLNKVGAEYPGG